MSEVNDIWIKPELKNEMENLAGFLHPLNEADREIFREGFRSALATIKYDDLQSQLEAMNKNCISLNLHESRMKAKEQELEACKKERDELKDKVEQLEDTCQNTFDLWQKAMDDREVVQTQLTEAVKERDEWKGKHERIVNEREVAK